jgi:hypothetical protein
MALMTDNLCITESRKYSAYFKFLFQHPIAETGKP